MRGNTVNVVNFNKIIKNKNLNQSIRIFGAKLLPQIRYCNTIRAENGLDIP